MGERGGVGAWFAGLLAAILAGLFLYYWKDYRRTTLFFHFDIRYNTQTAPEPDNATNASADVYIINSSNENLFGCSATLTVFQSARGHRALPTAFPALYLGVAAGPSVDLKPNERYNWPPVRLTVPQDFPCNPVEPTCDPNRHLVQGDAKCSRFDWLGNRVAVKSNTEIKGLPLGLTEQQKKLIEGLGQPPPPNQH